MERWWKIESIKIARKAIIKILSEIDLNLNILNVIIYSAATVITLL